MDEVKTFLRLLLRHKIALIVIPVITIIITFFLVRNLPNTYVSQSQISTGIVDDTQSFLNFDFNPKGTQINQEFSNLMEMMKMKKMLDQVAYQLIIHDFTSKKPFRPKSELVKELKPYHIRHAIDVFTAKYNKNEGLNLWDQDEAGLYRVLQSMKYNSEAIRDKLRVYRAGDSDFINVEFSSENPELSAFVVNTLSAEFIKYYSFLIKTNQRKAASFLGVLLAEKKQIMETKIDSLRNYKIRNRVLNLDEQSKQLYTQIVAYNDRKQQLIESIASKGGALNEIDRKFDPNERSYLESKLTKLNQDLVGTREELRSLYDTYITNEYDEDNKRSIDSLRTILSGQINRSMDQFVYSPLLAKQELVQKKLDLEIELDLARYGMSSLERELARLNNQFDSLVPKEAEVQSMERDVDVTSREYLDVLTRYNQSNLEANFSAKLNLVQLAMPGLAQASKKMLLIILSGIISLVFCLMVIFLMYFFDNRILTGKTLANKSGYPVLGVINTLDIPSIDLRKIWTFTKTSPETRFRNQLRSLRNEIDKDLKSNIILITSMTPDEGKSFISLSLAFAWEMTNKKVLLIDGNFTNPHITHSSSASLYLEDFIAGNSDISENVTPGSIKILGNRGGDTSLMELTGFNQLNLRLELIKNVFDIIIVEAASLDGTNHSKEWMLYSENILAVFAYGQNLDESKKQQLEYLKDSGNFTGWIMNKVPST